MKTLVKFIEENKNYESIINAVYNQLGCDTDEEFFSTLEDVAKHGADCGFSGFIYHHETLDFYKANKDSIFAMLDEFAEETGFTNAFAVIEGFNVFRGDYSVYEIADAVCNPDNTENVFVIDVITWFALEQVSHMADNYEEDED